MFEVVVIEESGQPVPGAFVRVSRTDDVREHLGAGPTDAFGTFRLPCGLPNARLRIDVDPPKCWVRPFPKYVEPGSASTVVQLAPATDLHGTVFDADGTPLAGAPVEVHWDLGALSAETVVQSDDGGRYRCPVPRRAACLVVDVSCDYRAPSGACAHAGSRRSTVPDKNPVDIHMSLPVDLAGTVTVPEGPEPISCTVLAIPLFGRVRNTLSRELDIAAGERGFVFPGVAQGPYQVLAVDGCSASASITALAPDRHVRLELSPSHAARVEVQLLGEPAEGFLVEWFPTNDWVGRFASTSSVSSCRGQASLKVPALARGVVRARRDGDPRYGLVRLDGTQAAKIELRLEHGADIAGQVTGLPAETARGAIVHCQADGAPAFWARVDADGRFRFSGLPPGAYALWTALLSGATGGFPQGRSVRVEGIVAGGSPVTLDFDSPLR